METSAKGAKRSRQKPNRLGINENSDYNEMFLTLAKNSETGSQSNEKTSSDQGGILVINDSSDKMVSTKTHSERNTKVSIDDLNHQDLLKLIYKKVDAIEDHLIKINVEIANLPNQSAKAPQKGKTRSIDPEVLKRLKLPTQSKDDLTDLENKLENNEAYKSELVSNIL